MNYYNEDPDMLNAELIDQVNWLRSKDRVMNTLLRMRNNRVDLHGEELAHLSMTFWLYAIGEIHGN